jgi:hypothetical protein
MPNEKEQKTSNELAEKNYEVSDYKSNSELAKGLAATHEQVSDTYVEGTVDGVIENVDGEDVPLKRETYESRKADPKGR